MNATIKNINTNQSAYPSIQQLKNDENLSHKLRSQKVGEGMRGLVKTIVRPVKVLTSRIENRKAIKKLKSMSQHFLDDIGLTQDDIDNLVRGQITLAELNEKRDALLTSSAKFSVHRKNSLWLTELKIKQVSDVVEQKTEFARCG